MIRLPGKTFFMMLLLILIAFTGSNEISAKPKTDPVGKGSWQDSPSKSLNNLPIPEHVKLALHYFCNVGISAYFDLKKKVPKWFEDDYLKSGIPMMIPNDYISGKPYHLVKKIDMNDTSGFVYDYKNPQESAFEFVFKNSKTGELFTHKIIIKERPRGERFYHLDLTKRDYCINFFSTYAKIYASKNNGKAPKSLKQMLKGEGKLIESGWKWSAKPGENIFFEWGMDTDKCRFYHITERTNRKKVTIVQNAGAFESGVPKEGKDRWTFDGDQKIPDTVCVKTKFISADGLLAFYKSF